jgi:iron complex transport system ATP-binding protein
MLSTENISYHIGAKKILENVSLRFLPGCFNIILGPNGSGKSTFLNIISGELSSREGTVLYNNKNIASLKKSTLSRYRAVMSQQPNPGKKDFSICREVIELMNLQPFTERNYLTLSGGEKQRVHFARVLAQVWEKPADGNTRYLLLDEPLNNLDISYQQEFLQAAASFVKEGVVLVAVLHDINLAAQYGDRLFFFKEGSMIAEGTPAETITTPLLKNIFDISPAVIKNPATGAPLIFFQ